MLNKVLGIIDLHSDVSLGALTENRPQAATTLFARYAFIDFALSNFTNSEVDNIAILAKDHVRAILRHLSSDSTYLKNSKTGFLTTLINEKGALNPLFNTDIKNIKENDYLLYDNLSDYVIVVPVHYVLNIDFQKVLEKHINSGKSISLVYAESKDYDMFSGCEKVIIDALGNAQKFEEISKNDMIFNVNLGIYIFNNDCFKQIISKASSISEVYSIADMVKYFSRYLEKINCIKYDGKVLCFNSFKKYFSNSMSLLDEGEGAELIKDLDNIIYTTTHNSRPVLYGINANVINSLIANGSTINGSVNHSIIARDVVIEEGASVENCILFSHTVVKSGIKLKNVVSNKRCVFSSKSLEGSKDDPIYVKEGSII